jgi:hypothetical protein
MSETTKAERDISKAAVVTYQKFKARISGEGAKYKNAGAFNSLTSDIYEQAKIMTAKERSEKFEYYMGRDAPAEPIDGPAHNAAAMHLAWSIVYFHFMSEGDGKGKE